MARLRAPASVRRAVVPFAALVAPLLGLTQEATAQAPPRAGLWLEAAWGAGTVRSACSACAAVTVAYGTSSHLRIGGALSPRVLLGLELFALHSSDLVLAEGIAPVDAENGSLAPVVIWYTGGSGLFLKGGVGLARGTFTVRPSSGGIATTERGGLAITFGVGFDVGIASWLALTANLGTFVTAIGDIPLDGAVVDDVVATVYQAGLGIALR